MSNMISELGRRINESGQAVITVNEFNQLQAEWVKRTKAEYMVVNSGIATTAIDEISRIVYGTGNKNHLTDKQAANMMQNIAIKALDKFM